MVKAGEKAKKKRAKHGILAYELAVEKSENEMKFGPNCLCNRNPWQDPPAMVAERMAREAKKWADATMEAMVERTVEGLMESME